MYNENLKKGVTFRLDAQAAETYTTSTITLQEGDEFALSRDATEVEVRASRFVDGKPQKGRPRKMLTVDVARCLGVTLEASDNSTDEAETADAEADAESEAHAAALIDSGEVAPW